MIEIVENGEPRRVHVWADKGETFISFVAGTTEEEAKAIVSRGLGLIQPLNVESLFREKSGRRRRFIE